MGKHTSSPRSHVKCPEVGLEVARSGVQRSRIVKMDLLGNVLGSFGSFGQYDGQMDWPHDVGVDSKGSVYVGDVHFGMRIQKFAK